MDGSMPSSAAKSGIGRTRRHRYSRPVVVSIGTALKRTPSWLTKRGLSAGRSGDANASLIAARSASMVARPRSSIGHNPF